MTDESCLHDKCIFARTYIYVIYIQSFFICFYTKQLTNEEKAQVIFFLKDQITILGVNQRCIEAQELQRRKDSWRKRLFTSFQG